MGFVSLELIANLCIIKCYNSEIIYSIVYINSIIILIHTIELIVSAEILMRGASNLIQGMA